MSIARRVRVRALAKLNLDLRVLERRRDGYHELRSIFQTISLADRIEIGFQAGRSTSIEVDDGGLAIPDNLAAQAAGRALDAMRVRGRVEIRLRKEIPLGGGLGGGSSDAAAVLLALPSLTGRSLDPGARARIARDLGSDVAFFFLGGTAVGIGRGDELFPLPESPSRKGILIAPGIHVHTGRAYSDLSSRLSEETSEEKRRAFERALAGGPRANDFESVVFEQHARLRRLKKQLLRAGAAEARMTGSGSAVFGLFDSAASREFSLRPGERAFHFTTVSRKQYYRMWQRMLEGISGS